MCVYCVCMLHTPCPRAHWSRALCTPMNISIETDAHGRRKAAGTLGAGGSYELLSTGARIRTQVHCKDSKCSQH